MKNLKSYRVKTKTVTAMHTYVGQPLNEIRDFMIGCKNISLVVGDYYEGFNTSIEGSGGARDLKPGDYIVMSEDRNAAFMSPAEFEEQYEVDDRPQIEAGLVYALSEKYGFTVEASFEAVSNPTIRDFLINSLKAHATGHLKEARIDNYFTIQADEADIDKIVEKMEISFSKE